MVLSMERWGGKVAIVTGAGGGIGEVIVAQLMEQGLQSNSKVIAVDNRPNSLEELSKKTKGTLLHTFVLDVTQEEDVLEFFKRVFKEIGPVHILINSAGLVQQGNLIDGDVEKWRKVFDVNVIGLSLMTSQAVKMMKDNKIDGHIIHIGSYVGHRVIDYPEINVYAASKHALRALAETLRFEFNNLGLGIKITCISPGIVNTGICQRNDFVFKGKLEEIMDKTPRLKPDDVADAVIYALSTPPHVQIQELIIKAVGEPF